MEYDLMEQSILKNLQELSEFCVSDFKVNNYYELVDKIIYINNIVTLLKQENYGLYKELEKKVESED